MESTVAVKRREESCVPSWMVSDAGAEAPPTRGDDDISDGGDLQASRWGVGAAEYPDNDGGCGRWQRVTRCL